MRIWEIKSCMLQFTLLLFTCTSLPCCWGYVNWIFPGPDDRNLTFNYKDIVFLTWTSSIDKPYLNLWCASSQTEPQSHTYVNHTQVPTNGITSQTFDYSEYDEAGICHFQIEDSEGDDSVDTPTFDLKSDDSLPVATYGVSSTSLLAEATTQTTVTPLPTRTTLDSSSSLTSFTVSTTLPTTSRTSLSSTAVSSSTPSTPTSSSSPPQPLTTAAKAGISIGSIFCAVALVIAILLAYNVLARQKARKRQKQDTMNAPEQNPQSTLPEIGDEGAYNEINGLGRPHELYGIPMAELEWAPRHEIDVSRG